VIPDRNKPGVAFWATVAVVVVLVTISGYSGTYALMVNPTRVWRSCGPNPPPSEVMSYYPDGIGSGAFWESFYAPANFFDRKLRPAKWESLGDPTSGKVSP